jgi:hypothetical protein
MIEHLPQKVHALKRNQNYKKLKNDIFKMRCSYTVSDCVPHEICIKLTHIYTFFLVLQYCQHGYSDDLTSIRAHEITDVGAASAKNYRSNSAIYKL